MYIVLPIYQSLGRQLFCVISAGQSSIKIAKLVTLKDLKITNVYHVSTHELAKLNISFHDMLSCTVSCESNLLCVTVWKNIRQLFKEVWKESKKTGAQSFCLDKLLDAQYCQEHLQESTAFYFLLKILARGSLRQAKIVQDNQVKLAYLTKC